MSTGSIFSHVGDASFTFVMRLVIKEGENSKRLIAYATAIDAAVRRHALPRHAHYKTVLRDPLAGLSGSTCSLAKEACAMGLPEEEIRTIALLTLT